MLYYVTLGLLAAGVVATQSVVLTIVLIVMVLVDVNPVLSIAILVAFSIWGGWL